MRLEVNASKTGIGGWLYYLEPNKDTGKNEKCVVAMGAHIFTKPAMQEWDTKTKELYAIWRFVCDWDLLLRGRRFEIITDHANLTFTGKNNSDIQKRKLRYLSEFDYELV